MQDAGEALKPAPDDPRAIAHLGGRRGGSKRRRGAAGCEDVKTRAGHPARDRGLGESSNGCVVVNQAAAGFDARDIPSWRRPPTGPRATANLRRYSSSVGNIFHLFDIKFAAIKGEPLNRLMRIIDVHNQHLCVRQHDNGKALIEWLRRYCRALAQRRLVSILQSVPRPTISLDSLLRPELCPRENSRGCRLGGSPEGDRRGLSLVASSARGGGPATKSRWSSRSSGPESLESLVVAWRDPADPQWLRRLVAGGEARLKHREVAVAQGVFGHAAAQERRGGSRHRQGVAGREDSTPWRPPPFGLPWRSEAMSHETSPSTHRPTASPASRACGRFRARRSTRNGTGLAWPLADDRWPSSRRGPKPAPVGCGADGRGPGRRSPRVRSTAKGTARSALAGAGAAHVAGATSDA